MSGGPARIGLVWAQAANGVIGRDGTLPWRLPEDLAHFKRLTAGTTVVMGRKTWQSLPEAFRPLPGRQNIVVSGAADAVFPGAVRAASPADALHAPAGGGRIWVIGGASIYGPALAYADEVVITELEEPFAGDTYAPVPDGSWGPAEGSPPPEWLTSKTGLRYRIRYLARSQPRNRAGSSGTGGIADGW
jgi:dihydrofolate reductase